MEYSLYLMALLSVTLACQNCFDEDCDTSSVCNRGCVAGFFGRECNDKCPTNCIDSICQLDEIGRGVCIIGCSPGFYGVTCRAPCRSINTDNMCDRHTGKPPVCDGAKHGNHCELSCSCSGKACDNEGTCLESCRIGLFGEQCDQQCLPDCPMCHQQSGDCIVCKDGFYGDKCQDICVSAISPSQRAKYKSVPGCSISNSSVEASDRIPVITLACISVFLAIVLTIIGIWIYKRKFGQRTKENYDNVSRENYPGEIQMSQFDKESLTCRRLDNVSRKNYHGEIQMSEFDMESLTCRIRDNVSHKNYPGEIQMLQFDMESLTYRRLDNVSRENYHGEIQMSEFDMESLTCRIRSLSCENTDIMQMSQFDNLIYGESGI